MSDEVKQILIDLIDYYNVIGTDDDPGFEPFTDVVHRASVALKVQHELETIKENNKSADVDPFAIDVVGTVFNECHKYENDL